VRHSRLIASVVFVVLAIVVVTAATRRGDGTPAGPGWRVESSPFRLVFQHDGKDVFGQQPLVDGASGVPRMSYELRSGLGGHHLTGLESSHRAGKAVTYTVATDEDGRTVHGRRRFDLARGLRPLVALGRAAVSRSSSSRSRPAATSTSWGRASAATTSTCATRRPRST